MSYENMYENLLLTVAVTVRHLAAKVAGRHISEAMGALLAPRLLRNGTSQGAEAAVHAACLYLNNLQPCQVILKLDFWNAFNSILHDNMLCVVGDLAPELVSFVFSAYSEPSSLFSGDISLLSSEGVQLGNTLGPLPLCLTIHKLVSQLGCELFLFYLDNGTLGGNSEQVFQDLRLVEQGGKELGLSLNHEKSEVISIDPTTTDTLLTTAPNLQPTDPSSATLLGSPLGVIKGIGATIREKMESLRTMGGRLKFLHTQDALLLLRQSLAIPKLSYMLQTLLPVPRAPGLRSVTSSITNISFQGSDPAWTQALLPVKHGGLGIRSAVQLAPLPFLASAAGSSGLVSQIIPTHLQQAPLVARADALSRWSLGHKVLPH